MDPAVVGALLAQLAAAGGGGQQVTAPQRPSLPNQQQQPNFGFGGANVSTEALLALFSQQANTAAALAALQSGSAAARPRYVVDLGGEESRRGSQKSCKVRLLVGVRAASRAAPALLRARVSHWRDRLDLLSPSHERSVEFGAGRIKVFRGEKGLCC